MTQAAPTTSIPATTGPPPPLPTPVSLKATGDHAVTGPLTTLSGTVSALAHVTVDGQAVRVHAGHWSKTVTVHHGENVFMVEATWAGHSWANQSTYITRNWTPAEREAQRQADAARRQADAARVAAKKQTYIGGAVTIPYNQLNKNADAYAGKVVTYRGQILQIQEQSGLGGVMLVSVTDEGYGLWTDNIWVNYDGHVAGAENDIVTFYGAVVGSKSYDTQAGGTTYVPEVNAKYVVG